VLDHVDREPVDAGRHRSVCGEHRAGAHSSQGLVEVKAMLLGDSTHAFGPLIRKYYVDTTKKFPPIVRA